MWGRNEAGGNWYALYDRLEPVVEELVLAHPLRVRAIASARIKTDAIDARTLAHLLRTDLIPAAYVPPRETRDLRELLRYRQDLVKQRSALKNRVHSLLAKDGYIAPCTDLFGKEGRRWLEDIVLREQQRYQLQGYLRVLDCLTEQIHDVDGRVRKTCKLSAEAKLLLGVPGIGPLSALVILAELGDISRFPTAEHAVSFARLAPSVLLLRGKTRHGQTGSERPPLGAD